jgi:acyl-CoA thioester hydrolase
LKETVEVNIRFSETDPMGIVWHGNYLKYLEDGREAFGAKYGIGYMDIYRHGFVAPLVEIDIKYKKSLRYGESILIETRYVSHEAAKIIFAYKVMNAKNTNEIIATANSIQVFLDLNGELVLTTPQFYLDWKAKHQV